jgi:hypothetical protein
MSTKMSDETDNDKPLDPAVEAIRQRLARLMIVSIGIMMLSLFAVLGAVVYKASGPSQISAASGTLAIPDGMIVVDQSIDGDRLALRLRQGDGSELIMLFSLIDGSVNGQWPIVPNMKN